MTYHHLDFAWRVRGGVSVAAWRGQTLKSVILEIQNSRSDPAPLISSTANFRTVAHEIGHACGALDIYDYVETSPGLFINFGDHFVLQAWEPNDWNSGTEPHYYASDLSQVNLINRLLMYGRRSDTKCDIPSGHVRGLVLIYK